MLKVCKVQFEYSMLTLIFLKQVSTNLEIPHEIHVLKKKKKNPALLRHTLKWHHKNKHNVVIFLSWYVNTTETNDDIDPVDTFFSVQENNKA